MASKSGEVETLPPECWTLLCFGPVWAEVGRLRLCQLTGGAAEVSVWAVIPAVVLMNCPRIIYARFVYQRCIFCKI